MIDNFYLTHGVGSDIDITPVNDTPEWRKQMAESVAERKRLGISAPEEDRPPYIPELNNPRRLEGIAIALAKRGHSASVIEKVIGGNFQRVFRDIWETFKSYRRGMDDITATRLRLLRE